MKRSIWEEICYQYVNQDESSRLLVMQQSTRKSQITYPAFKNSYLIHFLIKSNVLNKIGKLDKISTWKKYKFSN